MWRTPAWLWGLGSGCAAQLSLCCLGGFLARLRSHSLCGVLLSGYTLSERRGFCVLSTPHGFAYCKSSRERRVGSPAGQCLGCACVIPRVRPRQSSSWDRASRFAPARLSRAPRPGCDSPPRPLPGVSPYQMQRVSISLTRLLLVVHNPTLIRHHPSRTSYGHTFSG